MSEALIFASTNPQYDDRLFIELQVQYMKIPSSSLGRTRCVQKLFLTFRTIFVHNMFSHVLQKEELLTKIYLYQALLDYELPHKLVAGKTFFPPNPDVSYKFEELRMLLCHKLIRIANER